MTGTAAMVLAVLGAALGIVLAGLAITPAGRAVWQIAIRGVRQHRLVSVVTILTVALSAGLVMTVFAAHEQSRRAFLVSNAGFDAVLGARGSELQHVLNAIYHLEASPGNLPWSIYREVAESKDPRTGKPMVARAVPYALGDNYRGYRIIGTTRERFDPIPGHETSGLRLAQGRYFDEGTGPHGDGVDADGQPRREAVIGNHVARTLGLTIGSTFQPYHGLEFDPSQRHAEVYVVVGILEPTNRPDDRVLFIPIEGIFRMEGHALFGAGEVYVPQAGQTIPDEHKEVSAVLLTFADPRYGLYWDRTINILGRSATLAYPVGSVINQFFQRIRWVLDVFGLISVLVVVIAAAGVMASLYATMTHRQRQVAVLRAMGARRRTVFGAAMLQATWIGIWGGALGFVVYAAMTGAVAAVVRAETGIVLTPWQWHPIMWQAPVGVALLSAAAGLLPAIRAYSVDVAARLHPLD